MTLGVVPNQAGTVAMAVYAAGVLDATSVKVGFMRTEYEQAVEILLECREALEGFDTKLIGSLFADNPLYDGLEADHMIDLAQAGKCDGWLIDTLTKDGRNLFDFIPEAELRDMVLAGKNVGMSTALSGHLKMDDLDELARINPDIVGVRGAVCQKGDRVAAVHREAVGEFRRQLDLRKSGQISVREAHIMAGNGAKGNSSDDSNGWACDRWDRQDLRRHSGRPERSDRNRLTLVHRGHHSRRPEYLRRGGLGRRAQTQRLDPAQGRCGYDQDADQALNLDLVQRSKVDHADSRARDRRTYAAEHE